MAARERFRFGDLFLLWAFLLAGGCSSSSQDVGTPEVGTSADSASLDEGTTDSLTSDDSGAESDAPSGDVTTSDALSDAPSDSPSTGADLDMDGLDDARELEMAKGYYPYVSVHPSDKCSLHGVIVRVSPHPIEKGRVMIWYDMLYDNDCGAGGHIGDDEEFGVVIDPTKPAPEGILAVRAISHQGTACERVTTCGKCTGLKACTTAMRGGKDFPTVFPSKDKHGNYTDSATCSSSFVCDFGGCALAPADAPPIVNVGEPGHPLVKNLTTEGFITAANGWKNASLMNFDPWKPGIFGGAGDVSNDLVDLAFVVDTKACP